MFRRKNFTRDNIISLRESVANLTGRPVLVTSPAIVSNATNEPIDLEGRYEVFFEDDGSTIFSFGLQPKED